MDSLTLPNPLPARNLLQGKTLSQGRVSVPKASQVKSRYEESPNLISNHLSVHGGTNEELTEGIENISDPDPDHHIDQFQETLVLDK